MGLVYMTYSINASRKAGLSSNSFIMRRQLIPKVHMPIVVATKKLKPLARPIFLDFVLYFFYGPS